MDQRPLVHCGIRPQDGNVPEPLGRPQGPLQHHRHALHRAVLRVARDRPQVDHALGAELTDVRRSHGHPNHPDCATRARLPGPEARETNLQGGGDHQQRPGVLGHAGHASLPADDGYDHMLRPDLLRGARLVGQADRRRDPGPVSAWAQRRPEPFRVHPRVLLVVHCHADDGGLRGRGPADVSWEARCLLCDASQRCHHGAAHQCHRGLLHAALDSLQEPGGRPGAHPARPAVLQGDQAVPLQAQHRPRELCDDAPFAHAAGRRRHGGLQAGERPAHRGPRGASQGQLSRWRRQVEPQDLLGPSCGGQQPGGAAETDRKRE